MTNKTQGPAIIHLTLNTGHSRVSPRDEVNDRLVADLRPLVPPEDGDLAGPLVHPFDLYEVRTTREPGCAMFTVESPVCGPLVTCTLAYDMKADDYAWGCALRTYRQSIEIAASVCRASLPAKPNTMPWLAITLWPTAALDPRALRWLGDFERCMAWTIIESAQQDEAAA